MSAEEERWSLYEASQYLPAVLTDPNRGKQANFFTKTWGDSFVEKTEIEKSPFLPEITYAHFESYLRKYGRRFRRHSRLSQTKFENNHLKPKSKDAVNTEVNTNGIPEIYLRQNFNLNDPKVFSAVFQNEGKSENDLQDELSHYLDVVEEQIAIQVSQKSGAFFHAMTSHDTIMEQMGVACKEVSELRGKVQRVDKLLAKDSLRLIGLARSKANHVALVDKLKLMSTVLQTQPTLQLLLSSSDYVGALELISGAQEVLAKELAGVTSLRHLPSQLKEMLKLIDKMLSTEFERYAASDLHRPLDSDEGVLEPERLVSLVAGLLRQNHLQFLEAYKQEAVTAAQATLKQLIIEQLADAEEELDEVTGPGEVAPSMDADRWLTVLRLASDALKKLILRVKAVHDVVRDTAESAADHVGPDYARLPPPADRRLVAARLDDLLASVCNYCDERLAALVGQRPPERHSVAAVHVAGLAAVADDFAGACEAACGRRGAALRAAFKIQAGGYVQRFHAQRKHKLTLVLDAERWRAADVPTEIQVLVDRLGQGEVIEALPGSPTEEEMSSKYTNKPAAALKVGSEEYVTVAAALILVRLVAEYCVCACELRALAPLVGRHLSDLLRAFNSRSCQLVLGAGALRTAGLNTITSTNLALASRSLQLVLWALPHVRRHFRSLTGDDDGPAGFDGVEADVGHHVRQLGAKVASIVGMLVGEQLVGWEARPPVPSRAFRNISRHLTKLHEAISTVLPEEQVIDIYEAIHQNFKTRIREQLQKMNIQNNGGPQHGIVTSEMLFYLQTMRILKALPEKHLSDGAMDDIWTR